jgi:hypothetical protein
MDDSRVAVDSACAKDGWQRRYEGSVDDQLDVLLATLGLNWTASRLSEEFSPYELGDSSAVAARPWCSRVVTAAPGNATSVLKLPRVPVNGEWMRWDTCLRALRHEGAVLTKCRGMQGSLKFLPIDPAEPFHIS